MDLGELINALLTILEQLDFCTIQIIDTSNYSGSPDPDDPLRCIGDGIYCRNGQGALVSVIEERGKGIGMGGVLNDLYARELAKLSEWNRWALKREFTPKLGHLPPIQPMLTPFQEDPQMCGENRETMQHFKPLSQH